MNVRCPQCEAVYRVDPARVPEGGVKARCAACAYVIPVTLQRGMAGAPHGAVPEVEAAPRPSVPQRPVETAKDVAPQPAAERVEQPAGEVGQQPTGETAGVPAAGPMLVRPEPEPTPPQQEPEGPPKARYSRPFIQPRSEPEPTAADARPSAPVFRPTPGTPPVETPAVPESPAATPASASAAAPTTGSPTAQPRRHVNPFLSRDPTQKARRLARALVSDMIVYQPKKRQEALEKGTLKEDFEEEIKKSWEEYTQQVGEDLANSTDFFTDALNDILAGGRQIF